MKKKVFSKILSLLQQFNIKRETLAHTRKRVGQRNENIFSTIFEMWWRKMEKWKPTRSLGSEIFFFSLSSFFFFFSAMKTFFARQPEIDKKLIWSPPYSGLDITEYTPGKGLVHLETLCCYIAVNLTNPLRVRWFATIQENALFQSFH